MGNKEIRLSELLSEYQDESVVGFERSALRELIKAISTEIFLEGGGSPDAIVEDPPLFIKKDGTIGPKD